MSEDQTIQNAKWALSAALIVLCDRSRGEVPPETVRAAIPQAVDALVALIDAVAGPPELYADPEPRPGGLLGQHQRPNPYPDQRPANDHYDDNLDGLPF